MFYRNIILPIIHTTANLQEAFVRLPLPYVDEEFKMGTILKDVVENKTEPAPYVHIRRSILCKILNITWEFIFMLKVTYFVPENVLRNFLPFLLVT